MFIMWIEGCALWIILKHFYLLTLFKTDIFKTACLIPTNTLPLHRTFKTQHKNTPKLHRKELLNIYENLTFNPFPLSCSHQYHRFCPDGNRQKKSHPGRMAHLRKLSIPVCPSGRQHRLHSWHETFPPQDQTLVLQIRHARHFACADCAGNLHLHSLILTYTKPAGQQAVTWENVSDKTLPAPGRTSTEIRKLFGILWTHEF